VGIERESMWVLDSKQTIEGGGSTRRKPHDSFKKEITRKIRGLVPRGGKGLFKGR